MAYQIVPILMTLSDFERYAPNEGLLKCIFRTIVALVQQLTRFQLT